MSRGKHRLAPPAKPSKSLNGRSALNALSALSALRSGAPNPRLAYIVAPLATAAVVTAGVSLADVAAPDFSRSSASLSSPVLSSAASKSLSTSAMTGATRTVSVSRDLDRLSIPVVKAQKWTVETLDLRLAPGARAKTDGVIESGKRIGVTGVERDGYAEVAIGKTARWVTAKYLADKKPVEPVAPAQMGLQSGGCAGTSGVETGLVPDADRVYEAVCHAFPAITTYGGYDAHGEHSSGKAIDIMVGSTGLGPQIAEFLRAHAGELNLYDVIWAQHIWTPVRSSEGWRSMPDRGSATANHFDHVHVSVN